MAVRCRLGQLLPLLSAGLAACNSDEIGTPIPIDAPFATVSAGVLHTCGVTTAGTAYCWGWNRTGQLGDGLQADLNTPVAVVGGLKLIAVSVGIQHACALAADSTAY